MCGDVSKCHCLFAFNIQAPFSVVWYNLSVVLEKAQHIQLKLVHGSHNVGLLF